MSVKRVNTSCCIPTTSNGQCRCGETDKKECIAKTLELVRDVNYSSYEHWSDQCRITDRVSLQIIRYETLFFLVQAGQREQVLPMFSMH
jgi:hypothetical protein